MKNKTDEALEKQPLAVGAKILEMKRVSEEAGKPEKVLHIKEVKKQAHNARGIVKEAKSKAKLPFSTLIKKVHSLGDFYGKFHPSKSNKGIKRSE